MSDQTNAAIVSIETKDQFYLYFCSFQISLHLTLILFSRKGHLGSGYCVLFYISPPPFNPFPPTQYGVQLGKIIALMFKVNV